MADPFVAEIRIFPFNFAPKGWAFCDGQLLPLSQNTALFSLLGTTYGGDGKSTFALPDLQGNAALHVGGNQPGPGLSIYDLGQMGGVDSVTLLQSEMPLHNHFMTAQTIDQGDHRIPDPTLNLANAQMYIANGTQGAFLDPTALSFIGGSLPHNNLMPYLTLNFNIALQGVFPARPLTKAVELRPVEPGDREFLRRVYASTRAEELAVVPWDDAQKDAFLRSQFDAQDAWWRENYAEASFDVVVVDGELVGRLYVHRGPSEIRIVDVALLPEQRGRGVGTKLLRDLIAEADAAGKSLTIHVERMNPALRWYEGLGFEVAEDKGVYLFLERKPAAT